MTQETITAAAAGDVQIDEVVLIANTESQGNVEVDLRGVFAEINLFEDLFSNSLYGNILIGDSNNLLHTYSIQGLEGLRIDIRTPGLSDKQRFYKTFGIYAITDQQILMNDRLQSFRLHFASLELLADAISAPLNRSFKSHPSQIVQDIYNQYIVRSGGLAIPRVLKLDPTTGQPIKDPPSLLVTGYPGYDVTMPPSGNSTSTSGDSNKRLEFIAPNWSALKTMSWVCNRAVPTNQKWGGTFLFFESNKCFHYASVENLIAGGKQDTESIIEYEYTPANLLAAGYDKYQNDVPSQYKRVMSFTVSNNFNILNNAQSGLFGGQIRTIDPLLKRYREQNYSAVDVYMDREHTVLNTPPVQMVPHALPDLFGKTNMIIDQRRSMMTRFNQPFFMYDNDQTPLLSHQDWLLQRTTRMAELSNYRLTLLVYGRTDMKVGNVIDFAAPGLLTDDNNRFDKYFVGYFLVTAIKHFISPIHHTMTLEVVKDGLETNPDQQTTQAPPLDYYS